MYLLIPSDTSQGGGYGTFTSHYVSINSKSAIDNIFKSIKFTSHYVSINSKLSPA